MRRAALSSLLAAPKSSSPRSRRWRCAPEVASRDGAAFGASAFMQHCFDEPLQSRRRSPALLPCRGIGGHGVGLFCGGGHRRLRACRAQAPRQCAQPRGPAGSCSERSARARSPSSPLTSDMRREATSGNPHVCDTGDLRWGTHGKGIDICCDGVRAKESGVAIATMTVRVAVQRCGRPRHGLRRCRVPAPVRHRHRPCKPAATYSATYKRLADQQPHLRGHEHGCVAGDVDEHLGVLGTLGADLVIGGPPCQGFSVAGKMDPADPRSRHVWRFMGRPWSWWHPAAS